MTIDESLRDQVRIAREITNDFDSFNARLEEEKTCTRSVYRQARVKLEAIMAQFRENDKYLKPLLEPTHEYLMRERSQSVEDKYNAFIELLDRPEKNLTDYRKEPDTRESNPTTSIGDDECETPINARPNEELTNEQKEAARRREEKLREERLRYGERPPEERGGASEKNLTSELADLLYDIKKNREDEIEEFDDDPLKWLKFKNMYQLSVHEKRLPALQKFAILTKKIVGKKGKAILDGIVYDPNNYERAWKAIVKHFHNQAQLVRIELREFKKLPKLSNANEKGQALTTLFNKTTRLQTNLRSIFKEEADYTEQEIMAKSFNAILVDKIENSLDATTILQWGNSRKEDQKVPELKELLNFIEKRANNIEHYIVSNSEIHQQRKPVVSQHNGPRAKGFIARTPNKRQSNKTCELCHAGHDLAYCRQFKDMKLESRWDFVIKNKICANCFKHPFDKQGCRQNPGCDKCSYKHHSLMHRAKPQQRATSSNQRPRQAKAYAAGIEHAQILSPTALVSIRDIRGKTHIWRALLDSGADVSFITQRAVEKLQIPVNQTDLKIYGIGGTKQNLRGVARFELTSRVEPRFSMKLDAIVLKTIDEVARKHPITISPKRLENMKLADPEYGQPREIDLLLGIPEIAKIIRGKTSKINSHVVAIDTKLGHVLFGSVKDGNVTKPGQDINCYHANSDEWDKQMSAFWEVDATEDIDETMLCEKIYTQTLKKLPGRYEVGIPFKGLELGQSQPMAYSRFCQNMSHLEKHPEKATLYRQSMDEMISTGEMEKIRFDQAKNILPHSGVYKPDSLTTKLRVVFDGSAKTSNGRSLNDVMMVGPKLQNDICIILMRFRQHSYVISADVTKMFRQIRVRPEDAAYQCVLWENKHQQLGVYRINSVVFGLSASPYLAIRTMHQVAEDEGKKYPIAKKVIMENMYVDDVLASFESVKEATNAAKQVQKALANRGFPLNKWVSNNKEIIKFIPDEQKIQLMVKDLNYEGIKALGFQYDFKTDYLHFKLQQDLSENMTKREVLSRIMGLYDPTGLLQPLTFTLKIIMQDIWAESIEWDQQIPDKIAKRWRRFQEELPEVGNITIKRCVNFNKNSQLIAFSDGSDRGYGAAIYVRNCDNPEKPTVELLMAKSRVGHVKKPQTTPRMELMGAVLMAELVEKAAEAYHLEPKQRIIAYLDSQVVIAQLQVQDPDVKLKKFVANRVKFIQERVNYKQIYYIDTKENPADKLTRGLMPKAIVNDELWWHGPERIRAKDLNLKPEIYDCNEELKKVKAKAMLAQENEPNRIVQLIKRSSSWIKIRAIVARIMRWKNKNTGPIKATEIVEAEDKIISCVQRAEFTKEIQKLEHNEQIKKGVLASLTPRWENGLLRVHGRLQKSDLNQDAQHNVIIPRYIAPEKPQDYDKEGDLAKLLIMHAHLSTLHGGAQQVLMYLQQKFRIINAKSAVKYILKRCVVCKRYNTPKNDQLMGSLPSTRVTQAHCFVNTTVDYFGPITMRAAFYKSAKTMKCWGAVFVCSATKAIHLELVTELTADSYIAALKRFIGRRGLPRIIQSDNGTNFTAAEKITQQELKEFMSGIRKQDFQQEVIEHCANLKIDFKFIPPYCPHVGGLWEAGVKSAKRHLMKMSGAKIFNYEELLSLFIQVEEMLNSRPLVQQLDNDSEAIIITPGHFLTGRQLNALPEADLKPVNVIKRWKNVEKQAQMFWKVWSNDYLHDLQQRTKWKTLTENVKIGQLVLLKSDILPKCSWHLAKITKLYPDEDGIVRIVEVSRGDKTDKRHLVKLCVLPIYSAPEQTVNSEKEEMDEANDMQRQPAQNHAGQQPSQSKESPAGHQATMQTRSQTKRKMEMVNEEDEKIPVKRPNRKQYKALALIATTMAIITMMSSTMASPDIRNTTGNTTLSQEKRPPFKVTVQATIIRNMTKHELTQREQVDTNNKWPPIYYKENVTKDNKRPKSRTRNQPRSVFTHLTQTGARTRVATPEIHPSINRVIHARKPYISKIPRDPEAVMEIRNQKVEQNTEKIATNEPTRPPLNKQAEVAKIYNVTEGSLILASDDTIYQYFGTINLEIKTPTNTTADLILIDEIVHKMEDTCVVLKYEKIQICLDMAARVKIEGEHARTQIQQYFTEEETTQSPYLNYRTKRFKRSSRGVLQSIITWLFGGEEDFQDVREHEIQTDKEIEKFRRHYNTLAEAEKTLDSSYEKMRLKMSEMDGEFSHVTAQQYIHLVYATSLHALEAMQRTYNELIKPVFSTEELHALKKRLLDEKPDKAVIPPTNFQELLETSDKKVSKREDGTMKLTYQIPIVFKEEYHAMKILATPNINESTILKVPNDRIAVNEIRQMFFYLTPDIKVKTISNQVHIAYTSRVKRFASAEEDCIANAILRHDARPRCKTENLQKPFKVFKQIARNKYLFYTSEKNAGYLICPNSRNNLEAKIGIINIPPKCEIDTTKEIINAPIDSQIKYQSPSVYIIPENEMNVEIESPEKIETLKLPTNKIKNLPEEEVNDKTNFLFIEEHHVKYHLYAMWGIFASLTILMTVWIIYSKQFKKRWFYLPPIEARTLGFPTRQRVAREDTQDPPPTPSTSFENILQTIRESNARTNMAQSSAQGGSPKQNLRTFMDYDEPKSNKPIGELEEVNLSELPPIRWPSIRRTKH